MLNRLLISFACLATLGACVTAPEPCTTEWVEYKTEKVLKRFAVGHYGEVRSLKRFADTLEGGNVGPLTLLKLPSMIEDFKSLATDFEQVALPELNAAIDQCGSAETLIPAFTGFLRKEGVGEDVLEWVELLSAFAVDAEISDT